MSAFIIIIAITTGILLWLLTRPLLKTRNSVSYERQAQNIHYARERLTELEAQLKNATISAVDYEALKLEIEQTLADDIDLQKQIADTPNTEAQQSSKRLIIILCTLLPLCAVGIYSLIGTPAAVKTGGLSQAIPKITPDNIQQVLDQVQQRLTDNPDDIPALNTLAQVQHGMGRYQDAIKLNQRLLKLTGDDPDILSRLADATALANKGNLAGDATQYIQRALTANAQHPQALWLAGLAALQQGDIAKARGHWNTLLPLIAGTPQEAELKQIIQQSLNRQADNTPVSKSTPASNTKPISNSDDSPLTLTINVSLSDALKDKVNDQDTVFVFAKAQQGPPAPLAAKRLTVADLPTVVTLTTADAMMPQLTIAGFKQLAISARVSKSGQPIAQTGDLASTAVTSANDNLEEIKLVIDQVVE